MEGLTREQEAVVEASRTVKRLKVEALAGTGKTTVLVAVARDIKTRSPIKRILYTAFNRMVVDEVADKIRRFADCATVHSLALQSVGSDFVRWKFENNPKRLRPSDAAQRLGITSIFTFETRSFSRPESGKMVHAEIKPAQQFRLARRSVECFMRTPDKRIGIQHVDDSMFSRRHGETLVLPEIVQHHVVTLAEQLWQATIAPNANRFEFDHDHYMKMWHLSEPKLAYDTVLFDEAQDADPLMRDVVERHQGQVIWCGDRFQSIYSWRGAVNAMEQVAVDETLYLTQSFRFGQQIADVANNFLTRLGSRPIHGRPDLESTVGIVTNPDAELYRLNISALIRFVELIQRGERPVINLDLVTLSMRIEALGRLLRGERSDNPEFEQFEDLAGLVAWLTDEDIDPGEFEITMKRLLQLSGSSAKLNKVDDIDIDRTHSWLQTLENAIALARNSEIAQTGRLLSTVHRVKGLQFDSVYVGDDFPNLDVKWLESPSVREQWHLAYVAVTRAKLSLEHSFEYVAALPVPQNIVSSDGHVSSDPLNVSPKSDRHTQSQTATSELFRTSQPNIKVVGTAYKQTELQQIAHRYQEVNGQRQVTATLQHESENKFDTNAVSVAIDGIVVGYLPKEFAPIVARKLNGQSFRCEAVMIGGHNSREGQMNYGVNLAVGW